MTELETMQRAKMYLDKLARGIDPLSNMELPQDSALNNIRLARCFFYVSGVLEQVIQNGGVVGAHIRTRDFVLPWELRGQVRLSSEPVRITAFVDALHQTVGDPDMKKLSVGKITEWMERNGYMCKEQGSDGKAHRVPTEKGRQIGIRTAMRQSSSGEYLAVYYDLNAQRFLLENLDAIQGGQ